MKVTLKRPITIGEGEGKKTIAEVDLSGLERLTGNDAIFCRQQAEEKKGESLTYAPTDAIYRLELAARASGVAVEVLRQLCLRDFEEVDKNVLGFLSGTSLATTPAG